MLEGLLRSRRLMLPAAVVATLALACTDKIEIPIDRIVEVVKEVEVVVRPTAVPSARPSPYPSPLELKNLVTLVKAIIGEPVTLDPAWHYDSGNAEAIFNVYEPLLFYKRERIDQFVPVLSTGWNISPDGKTYTFDVRRGVRFHEGGTLEPHDVAYSFR